MTLYAISTYTNGTTGWRAIGSADDVGLGEVLSDVVPPPSIADVKADLMAAVQGWLDAVAKGNGYDSLASCISYRGSAVVQWDADATAALAWRDAVWVACFQWQQSAASDPPATFPTSAEVIAQLPQPEAFGWVRHAPGSA